MNLLFDFDGTLVNSFDLVFKTLNSLAQEFNFKTIEPQEFANLKNFSSKELIQYLQIPIYQVPTVLHQAKKSLHCEILNLHPFENIYQVLQKLHQAKFSLGILTSNSIDNVNQWLIHNKMRDFFAFVDGESHYFGKVQSINKILKKYKMDRSKTFYIGDETRDIEAAKENNIFSVAVGWGFNSENILLQYHPDFFVKKPEDLLAVCGIDSIQ